MAQSSKGGIVLTKKLLRDGIWEGVIEGVETEAPKLVATHLDHKLEGLEVTDAGDGVWELRLQVPISALSDGVQTFVISDEETGETLGSFAISAGAPLSEDLRAEVDLLRAELDMLKRAFRRHCVETGA